MKVDTMCKEINTELLAALESVIGMAEAHIARIGRENPSSEFANGDGLNRIDAARAAIEKAKGLP